MVKPGILVVADNAALRATLARWLLQAGYALELAENPRRAQEIGSKAGIALAIVAPEGFGAAGLELARELAGEVEHVIIVGETAGGAGLAELRIAMPLSEQDVLAKVKSVLRPAPIPETPSALESRPCAVTRRTHTRRGGPRRRARRSQRRCADIAPAPQDRTGPESAAVDRDRARRGLQVHGQAAGGCHDG
jgi:DNA-binding response OmpR family regulator